MFTNGTHPKEDPRVQRTRQRLNQAFGEVVPEKPLADVTVQDVLDRAHVSRATFYKYYRDVNDLFLTSIETILEQLATALVGSGAQSDRVVPVKDVFERLKPSGPSCQNLIASGRSHDLLELAHGHFARGIEQRLRELPRTSGMPRWERSAYAEALAGTLFSLLKWWVQHGQPVSAEEMDKMFHRLAWRGVEAGP